MYVENDWLSLLHPHEFSDNFSDMDGFQDGGYIWAQGVLSYHLIKVPWPMVTYYWFGYPVYCMMPLGKTVRILFPSSLFE